MPNVNIPETETIKLVRTHQEKRRRQPLKKNDGHGRASASFYFALVNLTKACKIPLVKYQMAYK